MARIALGLIIVDGKLLMLKRAKNEKDKHSEMYGLIGGHVRDTETYIQGLKRESREESGLKLPDPKYINSYKFDDNNIRVYYQELDSIKGIKLNNEHTTYKLFKPTDLTKPSIIPTTKDMYKHCKRKHMIKEELLLMNVVKNMGIL